MARDVIADAAALMERAVLSAQTTDGRWLVALDPSDAVVRALGEADTWHRWALQGQQASAAPPDGEYDGVALRQPPGREALALAAELCAARLVEGGELWLYGANDEGIKSAPKTLEPWFDDLETLDTRKHCRLWRGVRNGAPARASIASMAETSNIQLPAERRDFQVYPSLFAKGELDMGTRWLLSVLPGLIAARQPRHTLDYACGIGILAAAVRQLAPDTVLHALDADALAIEAARHNLPGAQVVLGDGWRAIEHLRAEVPRYDLIISNPPLHVRTQLSLDMLSDLIAQARDRLTRQGTLVLVTQRQRQVLQMVESAKAGKARILAEDPRYRVWAIQR